jgi:hypothetical protein
MTKAKTKATDPGEAKVAWAKRPVIIDLADGPCEMCALAQQRNAEASKEANRPVTCCFRCGETDFTQGVHSDATKWMHSNGFRSVKPSHYHLWKGDSGANGKEAYWDELCITCYREDYMAVYPDQESPV